jgi:hypothetical protein
MPDRRLDVVDRVSGAERLGAFELRITARSDDGARATHRRRTLHFSDQRVTLPNPQNVTGDLIFFVELANSLKYTSPKPQDAVLAESLSLIGLRQHVLLITTR